jgi:hypothetical protein
MIDVAFVDAQWHYHLRDPRPLAEIVRANDLTAEQREFVAQVLLGAVPQIDGRTRKRDSEEMADFFRSAKMLGYSDAMIYQALADKFGVDSASVRRTIKRHNTKPAP